MVQCKTCFFFFFFGLEDRLLTSTHLLQYFEITTLLLYLYICFLKG